MATLEICTSHGEQQRKEIIAHLTVDGITLSAHGILRCRMAIDFGANGIINIFVRDKQRGMRQQLRIKHPPKVMP